MVLRLALVVIIMEMEICGCDEKLLLYNDNKKEKEKSLNNKQTNKRIICVSHPENKRKNNITCIQKTRRKNINHVPIKKIIFIYSFFSSYVICIFLFIPFFPLLLPPVSFFF